MSLHEGFLRGDPDSRTPKPPAAQFVPTESVRQSEALRFAADNAAGRVFLGVIDGQVTHRRLPDGRLERAVLGGVPIGVGDDRHIITVAGNRSGKGRAGIVPNLITYPGSMLVVDPKGDLARFTARHRSKTQTVHVLDPFGVGGDTGTRFPGRYNPLSILDDGSPTLIEDAGLIADALIVPAGNDPHWDESARMFIETVVLHVATWPDYEGRRDLITVAEQVGRALEPGSGSKYRLEAELEHNPAADGAVMMGGRAFYDRSERELESVLSTVRRHLHFLGYRQMKPALREGAVGEKGIDLADLKRRPTTIYLILPAMRMGTCSRWLRLFVNLTLAAMEAEQRKPRHSVLLCLDEFAVLGPMKTIEDAAGQIAGLGCKLWPILQDLGQLKALYKDRWETFMGNAGVMQFFGNSDMTTLEWIAKRLGTTTVVNPGKSEVGYDAKVQTGASGSSWSQSTQELMTPEEISRFFGRDDPLLRQLIIRPTFPPMVLQRAYYDQHELFAGKYDD